MVSEVTSVSDDFWSAEVLAECQKRDADIGPVLDLLSSNSRQPSWDVVAGWSAASKTLWRQWERLRIFRGVLMRRFEDGEGRLTCMQIVMPIDRRLEFVKMVHEGPTGGHLGRRRTQHQVQLRAYWPGWTSHVNEILQKCVPCQRYHRGKAPKQTPLKPFLAGEPWEVVSIDITGPHPKSSRGFVYILTAVDHFTKWAEALPIRNHTAHTVAQVLFDNVFSRFGMPMRCLSDQGAEFESELFQQLCSLMGINKIRTTAYKPSTNAVVERFHRTLNSMLAKVVSAHQRDWCIHLPTVMAAYRASVHESTKFSPNRLMFGHENRMPADIVLGNIIPSEDGTVVTDYVADLCDRQKCDFALVREHLGEAARRRKGQYDDRVQPRSFVPGQLVWYYYPRKRRGLSPKWQSFYVGPYRVVRLIDTHTVVIQRSKKSKCLVVHRDKLKACLTDEAVRPVDQPVENAVMTDGTSVSPLMDEANEAQYAFLSDEHRGDTRSSSRVAEQFVRDNTDRPKRNVHRPAYLNDYRVFRISAGSSSEMAGRQLDELWLRGTLCESCGRGFRQRHGLKKHLLELQKEPSHVQFASRMLEAWPRRGQRFQQKRKLAPDGVTSYVKSISTVTSGNSLSQRNPRPGCQNKSGNADAVRRPYRRHGLASCQQDLRSRLFGRNRMEHRKADRERAPERQTLEMKSGEGPSHAFHVGAHRLAKAILQHSGELSTSKIMQLTQQTWSKLSTGQAKAAAAASLEGIIVGIRALKPPEGKPCMDNLLLMEWLNRAEVILKKKTVRQDPARTNENELSADTCTVPTDIEHTHTIEDFHDSQGHAIDELLDLGGVTMEVELKEAGPGVDESAIYLDLVQAMNDGHNELPLLTCDVDMNIDVTSTLVDNESEAVAHEATTLHSSPNPKQDINKDIQQSESHQDEPQEASVQVDPKIRVAQLCGMSQEQLWGLSQSAEPLTQTVTSIEDCEATIAETVKLLIGTDHADSNFEPLEVRNAVRHCSFLGTPPFRKFKGSDDSVVAHTSALKGKCLHVEVLLVPLPPMITREFVESVQEALKEPDNAKGGTIASEFQCSISTVETVQEQHELADATWGRRPSSKKYVTPGQSRQKPKSLIEVYRELHPKSACSKKTPLKELKRPTGMATQSQTGVNKHISSKKHKGSKENSAKSDKRHRNFEEQLAAADHVKKTEKCKSKDHQNVAPSEKQQANVEAKKVSICPAKAQSECSHHSPLMTQGSSSATTAVASAAEVTSLGQADNRGCDTWAQNMFPHAMWPGMSMPLWMVPPWQLQWGMPNQMPQGYYGYGNYWSGDITSCVPPPPPSPPVGHRWKLVKTAVPPGETSPHHYPEMQ